MLVKSNLKFRLKKNILFDTQMYPTGYVKKLMLVFLKNDAHQVSTATKMVASTNILNVIIGHEKVIAFIMVVIYVTYTKQLCRSV